MDKYRNKYRIASARASFWDYRWNAAYFVTMCIQNRVSWFGRVVDRQMVLSEIGEKAKECWLNIPNHFPFVILGEFVIMPNHVHGIIIINKSGDQFIDQNENIAETQNVPITVETQNVPITVETQNVPITVETQNFASLPPSPSTKFAPGKSKNIFGPQSENLGSIIRGFKIGVTKYARLIQPEFVWQTRYHDRIIRDEKSYRNISEYIRNNPGNWNSEKDQFNQILEI